MKEATRKRIGADLILRQIAKKHIDDAFYLEVKNGPTWFSEHLLRLDAVAFKKSWKKPCITGYEVKVNRQDFLRDEKWPGYRQYCHRFYFACPVGLVKPEELPDDVGLIYYNPEKDCISTKRTALFRDVEIPWEMLYYLVTSRDEAQKHPFFSTRREFFEAWVQDKQERDRLGFWVRNKMTETIDELTQRLDKAEAELKKNAIELAEYKRVKEVMNRYGIYTHWQPEMKLENALKQKIPPQVLASLTLIRQEVEKISKIVEEA